LIALSSLYWFGAVLNAAVLGILEQRRTLRSHYNPLFIVPGANYRPLFNLSAENGAESAGEVPAFYMIGFLFLAEIYFTVMWIIHGFHKTAQTETGQPVQKSKAV
jgi:hypothetical protein